jgi:HD-GYP domain-containing protein (c-di-GMP phosphodiesterase class II)
MSSLSAQTRAADVVRATERLDAAPPADGADASTRILEDLRRFLEGAREAFKGNEPLHWTELQRAIERVVRSLDASGELFWLANSPTVPEGQDYLAVHQARVAILAVRIGMTTGLTGRRLVELGMGAALIDVGLWQLSAGALRRLGSLSAEEQALYRAHPQLAAERLRRWGAPSERIIETVLQHHEREQGQGFPDGLEGAAVCPEAKIVGLADVYVGLTAPPSPRPGLPPHEAIREIVRGKDEAFSPALIKALLSDISVFPPGTMVRLNTGETGRVVAINRNQPLRPRIEVVDGKSGPLPTPKLVNLAEAPFLYITGPVSGTAR